MTAQFQPLSFVGSHLLSICTFRDERATTPNWADEVSWEYVVELHEMREDRPNKSGLMIGGYAITGPRNDTNVHHRSLIQLDIDSDVRKNKETGQILEVTRAAPTLDEIRAGIDEFEWVAASSHSHDPKRGIIKYRITILPDRDIQRDEWKPLLEALDEMLHGALDRGAWPWSQAFYLPSCPEENRRDAFFEHNEGIPLPVDDFVERGREIIAARSPQKSVAKLGNDVQPVAPPATPENIQRVKEMLTAIDPDVLYPQWRQVCWSVMATGWTCAEALIREWSEGGAKFTETRFSQVVRDFDPNRGTGYGTLVHIAKQHGYVGAVTRLGAPAQGSTGPRCLAIGSPPNPNPPQAIIPAGVTIDHFYAYMPMHNYIFKPTGDLWPASSINARLPRMPVGDDKDVPASQWLDQNRAVEQMTWAPGESQLINDRLVSNGGWKEHKGAHCFNLYHPAVPQPGGDHEQALPWLLHIHKIYPNDFRHIVYWLAHRVQRPQEKINHALVLGGGQGIGKDTILEPVKHAVGPWNFEEVGPQQLLGRFNGFLRSVILRVSEARDLGDLNRFQFYDHMKTYIASPPDTLRVDEKHLREYQILNCCGVIITTNHKTNGIFLAPDDRRHYVAWSDYTKDDFGPSYWNYLWSWYEAGGYAHVAAFLAGMNISSFDPKAPPPKTPAFWDIVDANRAPEDAELADVLDALGNPDAVTLERIKGAAVANPGVYACLTEHKNRRVIPHRLEKCGYVPVRNPAASDGQWKIRGRRVTLYARKDLAEPQRLAAAAALTA